MDLPSSFSGPKLLRLKDLMDAGMDRDDVAAALRSGQIVRPMISGTIPHGVYATPESIDPAYLHELPDAMIGFMFDGQAVCHMQYAAMRHGLGTSIARDYEILLPASTRVADREGIAITRTRRPAALTEGVEEMQTSFGIPWKITSKARTVIDLMRAQRRNGDDWRHGTEALVSYLDDGGDPNELTRLSKLFENWLPPLVQTAIDTRSPGYSR